ncbi:putative GNAT family N-acetyltransferase [Candidatus Magnetomoraceae bacterium gMMP-15]
MTLNRNQPKIEIGLVQDEHTRAEVFKLRYSVFIEEMGQNLSYADHEKKFVKDELDSGADILFAKHANKIIATIRLNPGNTLYPSLETDLGLERFKKFSIKSYAYTSKLAIHQEWRGTNVLGKLFMAAYNYTRENGYRFVFGYCAPELVNLYEHTGFRRYKENIVIPNLGYRVPMVIVTEDIDYLKSIRSPFIRIARKYENPSETADWFAKEFSSEINKFDKHILKPKDFKNTIPLIPLFNSLSDDEVRTFLAFATLLYVSAGDKIIRKGDISYGMFILISGEVEISIRTQQKKYFIERYGKGEVFGEMAFLSLMPQTADVVAITDLKVLVISPKILKKVTNTMSKTGAKLMFNLSLILCQHLNDLNSHLTKALNF